MADIANPDCVCSWRIWICLDIGRFYEDPQRVRMSFLLKTVNRVPIDKGGRFDTSCTAVCSSRNSFSGCSQCRLESRNLAYQCDQANNKKI